MLINLLVLVVLAIIVLAFAYWYISFLLPFLRDKKEIEIEIDTNEGEEKAYWKKELKSLYLERYPVCGKMLYKIFTSKNDKKRM